MCGRDPHGRLLRGGGSRLPGRRGCVVGRAPDLALSDLLRSACAAQPRGRCGSARGAVRSAAWSVLPFSGARQRPYLTDAILAVALAVSAQFELWTNPEMSPRGVLVS